MFKGDRTANGVERSINREKLQARLLEYGPRAFYRGLLVIQERRKHSPKFALAVFRSVYGTWPRSCDKGPPAELPEVGLLEDWLESRPKRPRRFPKPAPLVERMEKPPAIGADGFVEGTLMTPEDFNEGLR